MAARGGAGRTGALPSGGQAGAPPQRARRGGMFCRVVHGGAGLDGAERVLERKDMLWAACTCRKALGVVLEWAQEGGAGSIPVLACRNCRLGAVIRGAAGLSKFSRVFPFYWNWPQLMYHAARCLCQRGEQP